MLFLCVDELYLFLWIDLGVRSTGLKQQKSCNNCPKIYIINFERLLCYGTSILGKWSQKKLIDVQASRVVRCERRLWVE